MPFFCSQPDEVRNCIPEILRFFGGWKTKKAALNKQKFWVNDVNPNYIHIPLRFTNFEPGSFQKEQSAFLIHTTFVCFFESAL